MSWLVLLIFVALAALGPLAGADTRNGVPSRFETFWRGPRQNAR